MYEYEGLGGKTLNSKTDRKAYTKMVRIVIYR